MAEAAEPCLTSGGGFAEGEDCGERAALRSERADVLAYLDRKIANATLVIAKTPEFADETQQMQRAWSVARDDIAHGLHEGECLKGEPQ